MRLSKTVKALITVIRPVKQSPEWQEAQFEIQVQSLKLQIEFEAFQGYDEHGIAIDDVTIKPSTCNSTGISTYDFIFDH